MSKYASFPLIVENPVSSISHSPIRCIISYGTVLSNEVHCSFCTSHAKGCGCSKVIVSISLLSTRAL